jgi:hypothetical protein
MTGRKLTASIYNNLPHKEKVALLSRGVMNHHRDGHSGESYDFLTETEKYNLNSAYQNKKFDMNNNAYWTDYTKPS